MVYKKCIFLVSLLLGIVTQAQIATLDSKKVFEALPEMAKLDTLVAQESEKYIQDFGKKRVLAEQDYKLADSLYKLKPKDEATQKAIEKTKVSQKELQDFETMASKKIAEYKTLLFKPYLEKIDNAVKAVAVRKKIMQVIDIQKVPLVYLNPMSDITQEVIKQLGIKN